MNRAFLLVALVAWLAPALPLSTGASPGTPPVGDLSLAGRQWHVYGSYDAFPNATMDPGPNYFTRQNVCVDSAGALHLSIVKRGDKWTTAEIYTTTPLGFGRYQFQVDGPITTFAPNVVLGLFPYAAESRTNYSEIDMEYARWNDSGHTPASYTVWPTAQDLPPSANCPLADWRPQITGRSIDSGTSADLMGDLQDGTRCTHAFTPSFSGTTSTSRFDWEPTSVTFETLDGLRNVGDHTGQRMLWPFTPALPTLYIPQTPVPLHINLYLASGIARSDQQNVEVLIRDFSITP